MPSQIISEQRATSNRNGGRDHPGIPATSVGIVICTAGLLWSEAVAAEVVIFSGGPAIAAPVRAGGTAVPGQRWVRFAGSCLRMLVSGRGDPAAALALTFALLHLACIRRLAETVPPHRRRPAPWFYGAGIGAASAVLTLLSGGGCTAPSKAFGQWPGAMPAATPFAQTLTPWRGRVRALKVDCGAARRERASAVERQMPY